MASELSATELEELRGTFKLFDKDGSGSISNDELGAILRARGLDLSADQLSDLVKKYDTNGDGDIDFEEFAKLMAESDVAETARFAQLFKSIDTDSSGSVSVSELRTALENKGVGLSEQQLQQMIQYADTDGNGELSFEEFLKAVCSK